MKLNTIRLFLLMFLHLMGLLGALIFLYAPPDDIVQNYAASLIYFGSSLSILAWGFSTTFKAEKNAILKYFTIVVFLILVVDSIVLFLIEIYANPAENIDINAVYIFGVSALCIVTGAIKVIFFTAKETK